MASVKIRYFVTKKGAGREIYYWQPAAILRAAGWQPKRLNDDQGKAIREALALNAQLDDVRAGRGAVPPPMAKVPDGPRLPHVQPSTLSAVIRAYEHSRFFTDKRERTKASYRQHIRFLERWGGDARVAAITPKVVEALYTALYTRTPRKASATIAMLRILLENARRQGVVTSNAAARAGIKGSKPSGRVWPERAVFMFAAKADELGWHSIGTAVIVNHWAGQREGDILTLDLAAIEGGRLKVKQSKTGARTDVPDKPAVRERIVAELARRQKTLVARPAKGLPTDGPTTLLLCETTGKPWSEYYFRHVFAKVRAALAAEHPLIGDPDGAPVDTAGLLFRHLRHTAVCAMNKAGCTSALISSLTGHSLASVDSTLAHYFCRTAELADAAAEKRLAYEARQPAAAGELTAKSALKPCPESWKTDEGGASSIPTHFAITF